MTKTISLTWPHIHKGSPIECLFPEGFHVLLHIRNCTNLYLCKQEVVFVEKLLHTEATETENIFYC